MKRLLRYWIAIVAFASLALAGSVEVGMTEARLIELKGAPLAKATMGKKAIYRWPDMQVILVDGVVDQIQPRGQAAEQRNTSARATQAPQPAAVKPELDTILTLSGIKTQVEQIDGGLEGALQSPMLEQLPRELVPAFKQAMREAFRADGLFPVVRAHLARKLDAATLTKLVEIYDDPLVQRMTALELDAGRTDAQAEIQRYFQKTPPSPARVRMLQNLDSASGASAMSLLLIRQMALAMATGAATALGGQMPAAQIEQEVGLEIGKMKGAIQDQVLQYYNYTYRDVSDQDISEYTNAHHRPELQKLIRESSTGLVMAFAKAGQEFGQTLKKIAGPRAEAARMQHKIANAGRYTGMARPESQDPATLMQRRLAESRPMAPSDFGQTKGVQMNMPMPKPFVFPSYRTLFWGAVPAVVAFVLIFMFMRRR